MKKNIALTMIVKNEEKNLPTCLKSAMEFVEEIIIVDTGSTDHTKTVALEYGAKVYDYRWKNDFSEARNFALSRSPSDWNLVLDADERIIKWDKEYLDQFMNSPNFIGRVQIMSNFIQNGEERLSQDFISRFLPKGVTFTGRIHEQVNSDFQRVNLPIEVYHTGYFATDKSERNLELLLAEVKNNPQSPYFLYQLARQYKKINQIRPAKDYFEQAYTYINRNEAYSIDLLVSYLYTLIELKQFQSALNIISKEKVWLTNSPDFHFVCGIFYLNFAMSDPIHNLRYLSLIEQSYLKCLTLQEEKEIVLGTSSFLPAYNLAVYYETTGNLVQAKKYYQLSAEYSYEPARNRLLLIK